MQFAARTEFLRLAAGELVYMGLLRTRLDAILPMASIRGRSVPLAPELFAIMADARLALGQISPEGYSCDTADGAGKSREAKLRRLALSVCADLEGYNFYSEYAGCQCILAPSFLRSNKAA